MVKRIINSEDISMAEALRILEEKVSNSGINEEIVNNTLDYLRKFSKVNPDKARELVSELMKRFGLARLTAIQVVNVLPQTAEELRILLGSEKREFTDKDIEDMLNLLRNVNQS
ncbi:MAG: RNA polymerase Rpb4 family protein [Vulcanisaeta sp.]|uniref:RNA polymerase Rpb4 family protein n=1 Tax=Vulcanisaeta sp. EB80 TaxID=1650660 RepID=UPI00074667D2|nr:RNA polymerase Rpb4 family protein [Vulcanisaeta sp. EB80]KUO80331.1 MAG: RNA polymerase Rpb4 [Vulcanisaeta sp. OSP_8]KUO86415.1 MAG: RNA polymerase Rpb4 [Vulcanisaeta sp. MG_3]MCG2865643.1 RNA polymerase Rpb4 family protein [Vulcanisaeta sp.]MCG2867453.1 RNA polymerase Rpb4 family protein [Vulcanisaeta sp.]MCG2886209.1 RNA polymerase Rpb4 family protein [Vulcanisaeta sp.]